MLFRSRWQKLDLLRDLPDPRVYHTATVCSFGKLIGSIMIFGGRDKEQIELADPWLLSNNNGTWKWTKAPLNGKIFPTARFQVNILNILSIVLYFMEFCV